ncbi:MAG TPA: DUF5686 family protein [Gemmatimonadales bacterium]|nr:DUF5686 family protein [Gemmatimonadales bacterium]
MRRFARSILVALVGTPGALAAQGGRTVVMGTVTDSVGHRVLPLAVVSVPGTTISQLTDHAGRFRLVIPAGTPTVEVRAIGYRMASLAVPADADSVRLDVYLDPIPYQLATIVVSGDDGARAIIARAIARKHDVLAGIHDYRYQGYVKLVVRDLGLPQASPRSILVITESHTAAYWERPNTYQETILARRQSNNLRAERNLVTVGEIVNFNRNRIDLGRYALVSPIADDALDHYRYRMLDTLEVDGRRVFRIAVRPVSEASPLFEGIVDVVDSTYDVQRFDLGVNAATRFNLVSDLRYHQQLGDVGGGRWMPTRIQLTGQVHLRIPFPGIPHDLEFSQTAVLSDFRFDQGHPPAGTGRYRIVVDDGADRPDSSWWTDSSRVPLSVAERAAWSRIDSIAELPPSLGRQVRNGVFLALFLGTNQNFFHFNRVDGPYTGIGLRFRRPAWQYGGKVGYGFDADRWQYAVRLGRRLSATQGLWADAEWHDETLHRPTLISSSYNPTFRALFARLDPLDYYRERGFTLDLHSRVVGPLSASVGYRDAEQWSLPVVTDYAVFNVDRLVAPNPPIADGHLRAFTAGLTYDSRPMLDDKGIVRRLGGFTWTRIALGAEVSAPSIVASDFSYRRYTLDIERRQRTLGFGITTLRAAGGIATGVVPPQRYFTVDFGMETATFQRGGFNTLADTNYSGTWAAMITVQHDFDRLLFAKSHLPLIENLPFTLSVHGGVFWTDFAHHTPTPADSLLITAPTAYSEVGFGLGNLTPFLAPFNLQANFTWQLSSYPTHGFRFGLGFTR